MVNDVITKVLEICRLSAKVQSIYWCRVYQQKSGEGLIFQNNFNAMVSTASLQSDLQVVTEKVIQQLQRFTEASFTKKPDSDSWSAAEVGEHILAVNKSLGYVMQAEGTMPDRAPDKKLSAFKDVLLDRSTKIEAPENVRPAGAVKHQRAIIDGLQKQLQVLQQILEEKDLNELCEVYKHPRLGRMTRLEWSYFITYHMERHCQQLEEVYKKVSGNVNA